MNYQLKLVSTVLVRKYSLLRYLCSFTYTLAIGMVLLLSSSRAFATNDENHIQEIMAGVNGNSKIQFIVIKQEGGGNLWGPQAGETQSRVMLVFFDAAGRETGKFKIG